MCAVCVGSSKLSLSWHCPQIIIDSTRPLFPPHIWMCPVSWTSKGLRIMRMWSIKCASAHCSNSSKSISQSSESKTALVGIKLNHCFSWYCLSWIFPICSGCVKLPCKDTSFFFNFQGLPSYKIAFFTIKGCAVFRWIEEALALNKLWVQNLAEMDPHILACCTSPFASQWICFNLHLPLFQIRDSFSLHEGEACRFICWGVFHIRPMMWGFKNSIRTSSDWLLSCQKSDYIHPRWASAHGRQSDQHV